MRCAIRFRVTLRIENWVSRSLWDWWIGRWGSNRGVRDGCCVTQVQPVLPATWSSMQFPRREQLCAMSAALDISSRGSRSINQPFTHYVLSEAESRARLVYTGGTVYLPGGFCVAGSARTLGSQPSFDCESSQLAHSGSGICGTLKKKSVAIPGIILRAQSRCGWGTIRIQTGSEGPKCCSGKTRSRPQYDVRQLPAETEGRLG